MEERDTTIENRIRELRKERNLSQEELAEALGISRQSIIALEQGRTLPSLPLAVSICQFFHSAFEEMFEFERQIDREIDRAFTNNNVNIKVINSEQSEEKENKMVDLSPWRPFREAVTLRDAIDRLFEDSVITPTHGIAMPKIDIKDQKDKIIVKAELPGIEEKDINVEILDNVMTISGEKKQEKDTEEKGYYYKESHTGSFSRSFTLPSDVMGEKAEASMENGILTVSVPKIEPKQAKKIEVKRK